MSRLTTGLVLCLGGVTAGRGETVKTDLLDGAVLRYRVGSVAGHLGAELAGARPTNGLPGLKGVVLDLRFTGGSEGADGVREGYDFFATNGLPLVVLVNSKTGSGGSALAQRLRTAGLGLVVGGTRALPAPDVTVAAGPETDRTYAADPYLVLTNQAPGREGTNDEWMVNVVDHTSEADLVRKKVKDGEEDEGPDAPRSPVPPVIRDPALARGVDLLKALAALHPRGG